jgi:flavin reductase (DIM6/NTAB) family NADH-FMN oxidoreductase RutF
VGGTDAKNNELKNTVGKALGRIPSGVFVVTARDGDRRTGMLGSFVQQAAFDPPAVALAVGKDRDIRELILSTRKVALCVIGEGDTELMRRFARPGPREQDAFDGLDVFDAPSGLPIVAAALAWLDCEVIQAVDFGADHELIVTRVTAGSVLRDGKSFTHLRGNGFHY